MSEDYTKKPDDKRACGGGADIMAIEGFEVQGEHSGSEQESEKIIPLPKTGSGECAKVAGKQHSEDIRPDPKTGPAGELVRLGMAPGEVPGSVFKRIGRYFKNVATSVFKPGEIFCPQIVSLAGGKLQYTLSEDIRVARAEAYEAGERSGKRQSKKLERYVEGEKAIDIFRRGETNGFNNGFTQGRNERAENSEEVLGGFEELNEFYNRKPDEIFCRLGGKLMKVYDWDDELSLYKRRYGEEAARKMIQDGISKLLDPEMLSECVENLMDPDRTMPALPGTNVEVKEIGEEVSYTSNQPDEDNR